MKKLIYVIPVAIALSGCAAFKTRLVPQAYMPEPPEILMKAPKELSTIKQPNPNMTVTNTSVTVTAPEGTPK
jgi:hypothetical protein